MEAIVQRPRFLTRPQGIALIILAIVAIWGLSPVGPVTVALLAVVSLFLIGLKKPLWAVAAFLVGQLTITSYMVSTPFGVAISLRLILLILIVLVLWRSFARKEVDFGPKLRRVLIPALVLLGLSVATNLVNSGFDNVFKDFRNMVSGLLIVILITAVTKNFNDLKKLCGVVLIAMTASAIIAIMQHYQFLGMEQNVLTLGPGLIWVEYERAPGISEDALYLAFTLPVAALAVVGTYLARGVTTGTKRLLAASVVLMGIALFFTYTRSALIALFLGLLVLPLFARMRLRSEVILVILVVGIIFMEGAGILEGVYLGGRSQTEQEESAYERKVLWQAGVAIAMDNPILGIGSGQYKTVSSRYESSVDPALMRRQDEYWGYRTLGSQGQELHNDFLMVWVCYGTLGLAAYLWFLASILRNLLDSHRISKERFIKGISIGLAAGLVAYIVNAFYHNCIDAMPLLWILAGFSVAVSKLAWRTASTRLEVKEISNEG